MDNTTRALSQAVSLDGWIGEFDENGLAHVHADIVFRQGAFGADADSQVRFKIALKRAEIVLRIPAHEPITVKKSSIRRTVPKSKGTKKTEVSSKVGLGAKLRASISRTPTASAEGEASYETSTSNNLQIEEQIEHYIEQHITTEDGHCGWEVATNTELTDYLAGSPWDAVDEPRLQVRKPLIETDTGESPTLVIEIRCAREDIEIIDLEQKDPEKQRAFLSKKNRHKNLAAAEQLIKDELMKSGFLEIPDLGEKHSRLLIADKIIFEDS